MTYGYSGISSVFFLRIATIELAAGHSALYFNKLCHHEIFWHATLAIGIGKLQVDRLSRQRRSNIISTIHVTSLNVISRIL